MSYLNTKPLVWAFEQGIMKDEAEIIYDYPSRLAGMLSNGSIDIGLIPVAAIPAISTPSIISDYCIGASGPVASVCLFSDVPMSEIETVLLDYQSRTSAALVKILIEQHWKKQVVYLDAGSGFESDIKGSRAGLVIGDRAFALRDQFKFIYDLAEEWISFSGLPFVFAAWVANNTLSPVFLEDFNHSIGLGIHHIDEIVRQQNFTSYNLNKYYTENIDYNFDEKKRKGMEVFLSMID